MIYITGMESISFHMSISGDQTLLSVYCRHSRVKTEQTHKIESLSLNPLSSSLQLSTHCLSIQVSQAQSYIDFCIQPIHQCHLLNHKTHLRDPLKWKLLN